MIYGQVQQPMIEIGGFSLPKAQAVVLTNYISASTQYSTFYRNGSAYQVPTGKKLCCVAAVAKSDSTLTSVTLGYGDTAVSSTSAPTNPVAHAPSGVGNAAFYTSASGANSDGELIYFEVPAGKYPYARIGGSVVVVAKMLCYLEDA